MRHGSIGAAAPGPEAGYAFALSGPARVQLAQVCEAYALCRAERSFDSLTFYRSLEPEGAISPTFGAKT